MPKDVLITPGEALIQFSSSAGTGSGQILADDNNNLVISNLVGDVLLGDGESDVFIGDGTNPVDIIHEQNMVIQDDGTGKNLTIGSKTTNVFITSSTDLTIQQTGGNVGIGTSTPTTTLQIEGSVSSSGTLHVDGNISTSGSINIDPGGDIIFGSQAVANTSPSVIQWDFASDDTMMYAHQSSSDVTYFVHEQKDNTTSDSNVFWFNDYRGSTYDSFPLYMNGSQLVVNYIYDRRTVFARDNRATNGPSNNVDFYLLKSGSSSVSQANSLIHGDVSNPKVTIGGILDVTDTSDSSDATGDTGAVRIEGGVSIAKKLFVGTDLDAGGEIKGDHFLASDQDDGYHLGDSSVALLRANNSLEVKYSSTVAQFSNTLGLNLTGHITASGNIYAGGDISASGEIIVNNGTHEIVLSGSGEISASGHSIYGNRIRAMENFALKDSGGTFRHFARAAETANELEIGNTNFSGILLTGNVTASGNISSSGANSTFGEVVNLVGEDPRLRLKAVGANHPGIEWHEDSTRKWVLYNDPDESDKLVFKNDSTELVKIKQDGGTEFTAITSSGNISSSRKIIGDDFQFNLPTNNARKFKGFENKGVRLHASTGGWGMEYGFLGNGGLNVGGWGGYGGTDISYFYVGNAYNEGAMTIVSGSTTKVGIGRYSDGTTVPKTLTVQGEISSSGDLFVNNITASAGNFSSHITASGNISSSLDSTGSFGTLNLEGTNFSSSSLASAIAGGGGGTPGGSNTHVQFNNSGNFGGSSGFTYNGSQVTISGTGAGLVVDPGGPGSGHITASGDLLVGGFISMSAGEHIGVRPNEIGEGGDVGTGITFNASTIGFIANERELMRMSEDKLGIGKTNPTKTLEVVGDISASGDLNVSGTISASGDITGSSTSTLSIPSIVEVASIKNFGTGDDITIAATDSVIIGQQTNGGQPLNISAEFKSDNAVRFTNHITASGNISASGDVFGSDVRVQKYLLFKDFDAGGAYSPSLIARDGNIQTFNAGFAVGNYSDGGAPLAGAGKLSVLNEASFGSHITASGNISGSSTSNITVGGTITGNTLAGTLSTAAQTNITSVGTLGSLTVTGDITGNGNVVGDGNTNIKNFGGVQDSAGENYIALDSNLKVSIGDPGGSANSTMLVVDDNNNKITMTGDAAQVVIGGATPAVSPITGQELTVVGEVSASSTITSQTGFVGQVQATGSYDFPGAIVGYTVDGLNSAHNSVALTTSMTPIDDLLFVSFVTPKSGNVEIEVQVGFDGGTAATQTTVGLSDQSRTDGYNAVESYYEQTNSDYDETDDAPIHHKWCVTGLVPGQVHHYWFSAKTSSTFGNPKISWGGSSAGRFIDFIMKATALPSNIKSS
jgi:hypothetical protein